MIGFKRECCGAVVGGVCLSCGKDSVMEWIVEGKE